MKQILIVEDDTLLNHMLSYNLIAEKYSVTSVYTATEAQKKLTEMLFDLIILDVNLPDGNGFDLCKQIKASKDIPVIFLTANDMESDMIRGYELGADDYVTKPFPISVFQKKITALIRRVGKQPKYDLYEGAHLWIDFSEHSAMLNGKPVIFTPMEYRTLKIFVSNPGCVLTRQTLLEKLWDIDGNFVDEHTLTSMISRIRSKIEADGFQYIKTVYGMGYIWIGTK